MYVITGEYISTRFLRGKSSTGWFHGFKLHLVINDRGEILSFYLTLGNVDDKNIEVIEQPKKIYIIFDHTTIMDKFIILQFSLKIGKRAVPIWYKMFLYKGDGNKDFEHVAQGLKFIHKIVTPYDFDVTILADRGFKSVDLFQLIDKTLKFK